MRPLLAVVAFAASACAANPSPVHVVGTMNEIAVLAGEWVGEYTSVETGRSGSITFALRAGTDTAFGDIVMVPRVLMHDQIEPRSAVGAPSVTPTVLSIAFVRVAQHTVSGTLAPYASPDCGCTLSTVFRGTIARDRIDGSFSITHSDPTAQQQRGTWWVTRKVVATP